VKEYLKNQIKEGERKLRKLLLIYTAMMYGSALIIILILLKNKEEIAPSITNKFPYGPWWIFIPVYIAIAGMILSYRQAIKTDKLRKQPKNIP